MKWGYVLHFLERQVYACCLLVESVLRSCFPAKGHNMRRIRIAVIAAALLIVCAVVFIVVSKHSSGGDLLISFSEGDVTVTHTDGTAESAVENMTLRQGDIITANDGASCTLLFTVKGRDEDYIYIEPFSQVFVTDDLKQKDNELYLNRGAVIVDGVGAKRSSIIIRTDSASFATKNAVVRVAYDLGEGEPSLSHVATFSGYSDVQLYNSMGEKIDLYGNIGGKSEPMDTGAGGLVKSSDPPKFVYLNTEIKLDEFNAATLKDLLTISSMNELVFSSADIKSAFDAVKPEETETSVPETTETESETSVTTEVTTEETTEVTTEESTEDTSEDTETERETETEPVTTTAPPQTVMTTTTTVQTTTVHTTVQTTTTEGELIPVYIVIDDEILEQEVPYGGSADIPNDPVIEGKRFIGWDDSFDNITGERTISALFEDEISVTEPTSSSDEIIDWGTYVEVTVESSQYISTSAHTVTFIVDGQSYTVVVNDGEAAAVPIVPPPIDSNGQSFIAWDQNFQNVTSDMTVYAVYG